MLNDRTISDKGWVVKHHLATGYSGNIEKLQKNATAAGHLYPALDFDGLVRRVPMLMKYGDGYYEALSLAMSRTYLGNVPLRASVEAPKVDNLANIWRIQIGEVTVPLDDRMTSLVPYRGASGVYRYVSATDVLRGTLPTSELKDKIIIVGTSAQGLLDLRATPVREDYPGVEVHANLISGILDQTIMHRPDYVLAISVLTVLLIGIPFAIALPHLSALTSTVAMAAVAVLLLAINLYVWNSHHFVLNIAAPLMMLALLYLLNMAWGFFMETRSRRLITGLFGTYVPKELVAEMSKNPEEYSMRGESREMTVLFSDVRDFTSISEGLTPEGLKDMMNAYLTEMTEVVQEKRGTIDKYIGDAIMAFWGAPLQDSEHAIHGVESALAMQKRIRALDTEFAKRGWPVLHIGVGLNNGEMNVGDMGSKFRPRVHGAGRRGEHRLAPRGPHQGVRRRHPREREHRHRRAGDRVPRGGPRGREGPQRGHPDLRAHRQDRRGRRNDAERARQVAQGARPLPQAALGRGAGNAEEPLLRRARQQALQVVPEAHRLLAQQHPRSDVEGPLDLDHEVTHPHAERVPAPGEALPVAPGVWWIRMPLPVRARPHQPVDPRGWRRLHAGRHRLRRAGDLGPVGEALRGRDGRAAVKNIVVTHYHPDHVGSAAWLVAKTGAPMWMTSTEFLSAHAAHDDMAGFDRATGIDFFGRNGLTSPASRRSCAPPTAIGAACRRCRASTAA
jgi:hypothetical protein